MGWGLFGRRRAPLLVWVLAILGIKSLWWKNRPEEREAYRAKRRAFRQKIGEAFDVWRDSDNDPKPSDEPPEN